MSVSAIKNLEVEMVKQQKEIGDFQKECMALMNKMGKNFERIESVIEEQQHVFKGHYTASDATCQKLATLCEFLTISLNEQDDKNELRDAKIKNLKSDLETTQKQANDLEKQTHELTKILESIEKHNNESTPPSPQSNNTESSTNKDERQIQPEPFDQHNLSSICNELQLRQQKQRNIVIFGLQENGTDQQEVEALVGDIGVVANISVAYRVGVEVANKPRTLVVRFETERNCEDVYNNLRNLKGKPRWNRISVAPDLTKIQCVEEKENYKKLLQEKKQKEEENTGNGPWKIVGNRGRKRLVYISDLFRG